MANNNAKLTNLEALQKLAERLKENYAPKSSLPTKVSELENDSGFQTQTEVSASIQTAIAETGHAKFEKADSVPAPAAAKENVLYLVMNADTNHYDIYALVGGSVERLDDTTVDLTGYVTAEGIGDALSDVTATDAEVNEMLNNVLGVLEPGA